MARTLICLCLVALPAGVAHPQAVKPDNSPAEADASTTDGRREEYARKIKELEEAGKYAEARDIAGKKLALEKETLGGDHPEVVSTLRDLAGLTERLEDFAAARRYREEALNVARRLYGEADWKTTDAQLDLAELIHRSGLEPAARKELREARDLHNTAHDEWQAGRHEEGLELAKRALEIRRRLLGEHHRDHGTLCNTLAHLYRALGQLEQAREYYEKAAAIYREALGETHPWHAGAQTGLAMLHTQMGKLEQAEKSYETLVKILRVVPGEDSSDYAIALHGYSRLQVQRRRFEEAEKLCREALRAFRQSVGENDRRYGMCLASLGYLRHEQRDLTEARRLLGQALPILQKTMGVHHPSYVDLVYELASLDVRVGDLAHAEQTVGTSLRLCEQSVGERHPATAILRSELAFLSYYGLQLDRAVSLFRSALEVLEGTLGPDHRACFRPLVGLGLTYDSMGDAARAETLLMRAEKILGPDDPDYQQVIPALASICARSGDRERAVSYFSKDLEETRKRFGERHAHTARALNNLGAFYNRGGEFSRARPLVERAVEIEREVAPKASPRLPVYLNNLAFACAGLGETDRAERLYVESLDVYRGNIGRENLRYADALGNLSKLYARDGKLRESLPLLEQALDVYLGQLKTNAAVQSERQKLVTSERVRSALGSYLTVGFRLALEAENLYRYALPIKGRFFTDQRLQRLRREEPELAGPLAELEKVASRLAAFAGMQDAAAGGVAWRREIETLTERREKLEAELAKRSRSFRRTRENAELTPERLRQSLPAGAVLVDFVAYAPLDLGRDALKKTDAAEHEVRQLAAFVLRRDRPPVAVQLGPLENVAREVEAWRALIAGSDRDAEKPGERSLARVAAALRARLLSPLGNHLDGARILLVSPDAVLGQLPFAALPGKKPATFLVEDVAVVRVPVPQEIPALLERRPGADAGEPTALVVGGVDYDGVAPAGTAPGVAAVEIASTTTAAATTLRRAAPRGTTGRRWSKLPFTTEEVKAVEKHFRAAYPQGRVEQLNGTAAPEEAFRRAAPHHRYIHLATHGFFASAELQSATTAEAPSLGGTVGRHVADDLSGWHPGLLSGIVLAGANRPVDPRGEGDDGILTALELGPMNLERTELLVLSACETGLGREAAGEGLLGLQRAAHVAGARTVVASLWKVDDASTMAFMSRFYDGLWRDGKSRLDAFREAQLALLSGATERSGKKRGPGKVRELEGSPRAVASWAAWVMSGDWR